MFASVRLLVENTARGTGMLGEHGLAWHVTLDGREALFDTGQGMALLNNAARAGVDLSRLDAIALSHGHYDHVGGLGQVLPLAPAATLHFHPDAQLPKFSVARAGAGRRISTPFFEAASFPGRQVRTSRAPSEVIPGLWLTGEIPRENNFEDTGGPFFSDAEGHTPDPLDDDQSLFFKTEAGTVVILGCAHAGVINTLRHIQRLTDDAPLHTVVGGMHLENASEQRLAKTIEILQAMDPLHLGVGHCTGADATHRIWNAFPGRCFPLHSGLLMAF